MAQDLAGARDATSEQAQRGVVEPRKLHRARDAGVARRKRSRLVQLLRPAPLPLVGGESVLDDTLSLRVTREDPTQRRGVDGIARGKVDGWEGGVVRAHAMRATWDITSSRSCRICRNQSSKV